MSRGDFKEALPGREGLQGTNCHAKKIDIIVVCHYASCTYNDFVYSSELLILFKKILTRNLYTTNLYLQAYNGLSGSITDHHRLGMVWSMALQRPSSWTSFWEL
uniref:Uncharacterized protein n=1 Tax=Micrurus surinamensis TaxID=129470 RepID=A0A2D4NV63_MICSU